MRKAEKQEKRHQKILFYLRSLNQRINQKVKKKLKRQNSHCSSGCNQTLIYAFFFTLKDCYCTLLLLFF